MPSIIETTRQFWNILNMYPEFHSEDLKTRINTFILYASPNELFQMQKDLFDFATPFFLKDEQTAAILRGFASKRLGLAVGRSYRSTLVFKPDGFEVLWGIRRGYPVFEVRSREAYRDGILRRVDPVKLIISRRVRVRYLGLLARWALPYWHILVDSSLFKKLLAYQDDIEAWMDGELSQLGF